MNYKNFFIFVCVLLAIYFLLAFKIGLDSIEQPQIYLNYEATKPISQKSPLKSLVSAYTLSPEETDEEPFITASGLNLESVDLVSNRFVACPRQYPFGTKFEIAGEIWNCQDRTAEKYDGRFDLLMPTKEMALNWGVREIEIIKL